MFGGPGFLSALKQAAKIRSAPQEWVDPANAQARQPGPFDSPSRENPPPRGSLATPPSSPMDWGQQQPSSLAPGWPKSLQRVQASAGGPSDSRGLSPLSECVRSSPCLAASGADISMSNGPLSPMSAQASSSSKHVRNGSQSLHGGNALAWKLPGVVGEEDDDAVDSGRLSRKRSEPALRHLGNAGAVSHSWTPAEGGHFSRANSSPARRHEKRPRPHGSDNDLTWRVRGGGGVRGVSLLSDAARSTGGLPQHVLSSGDVYGGNAEAAGRESERHNVSEQQRLIAVLKAAAAEQQPQRQYPTEQQQHHQQLQLHYQQLQQQQNQQSNHAQHQNQHQQQAPPGNGEAELLALVAVLLGAKVAASGGAPEVSASLSQGASNASNSGLENPSTVAGSAIGSPVVYGSEEGNTMHQSRSMEVLVPPHVTGHDSWPLPGRALLGQSGTTGALRALFQQGNTLGSNAAQPAAQPSGQPAPWPAGPSHGPEVVDPAVKKQVQHNGFGMAASALPEEAKALDFSEQAPSTQAGMPELCLPEGVWGNLPQNAAAMRLASSFGQTSARAKNPVAMCDLKDARQRVAEGLADDLTEGLLQGDGVSTNGLVKIHSFVALPHSNSAGSILTAEDAGATKEGCSLDPPPLTESPVKLEVVAVSEAEDGGDKGVFDSLEDMVRSFEWNDVWDYPADQGDAAAFGQGATEELFPELA